MSETPVPADQLGVIRPFDSIEWVDEVKFGRVSADVSGAAKEAGAKRKFMSRGEQGLYVQYSTLPPDFLIAPHAHSHGEVLFILNGGCTVEPTGDHLGPTDSAVVPAHHEYGLRCGPDGMEFLTIRGGDAATNFEPPAAPADK